MKSLCVGVRRGDAEVEVHVQRVAVVGRTARVQGLSDPVLPCSAGDARADFASRIEVFERALSRVGDGDLSRIEPRWNEHAITPSRRRCLHFEVTVEIVQRTEDGGGDGLLLLLKTRRDGSDSPVELAPFWKRFARRQQRQQRADFLLLLGTGERIAAAVEDAVQRVVVVHRDRIELVIVTPRTTETQPEHRLAQIVDRVPNSQVVIVLRVEPKSPRDREIAGRGELLGIAVTSSLRRI